MKLTLKRVSAREIRTRDLFCIAVYSIRDFSLFELLMKSCSPQLALMRPALLLGALFASGCASTSETKTRRADQTSSSPSLADDAATAAAPEAADAAAVSAVTTSPVPANTRQLIVTVTEGWSGSDASLHRFERQLDGEWKQVGESFETVVGHTGLAWGLGFHPQGGHGSEPIKLEGDGKSPAGIFAVGALYGYEKAFGGQTLLPYQAVDRAWRCVNDSKSKYYNRVLSEKGVDVDWKEAEYMRRHDSLYRLVIAIDHNAIFAGTPKAKGGSCIFFHVWRNPASPTIGCTAMPLASMKMLASWLDPAKNPVLVALPRESYLAMQASWQLPHL